MRLTVDHTSTYSYETGVSYALQQVRKRPVSLPSQSILSWDLTIDGAHWIDAHCPTNSHMRAPSGQIYLGFKYYPHPEARPPQWPKGIVLLP